MTTLVMLGILLVGIIASLTMPGNLIPMMPTNKMPNMTSVVITGRRMNSSGMLMACCWGRRFRRTLHVHLHAGRQTQLAVRDDRFARRQSFLHDGLTLIRDADGHRTFFRGFGPALQRKQTRRSVRLHCLCRHNNHVHQIRQCQRDMHKLSRPQSAVFVRERRLELNCAGRFIHCVVLRKSVRPAAAARFMFSNTTCTLSVRPLISFWISGRYCSGTANAT